MICEVNCRMHDQELRKSVIEGTYCKPQRQDGCVRRSQKVTTTTASPFAFDPESLEVVDGEKCVARVWASESIKAIKTKIV
jgi:hypothetical protein